METLKITVIEINCLKKTITTESKRNKTRVKAVLHLYQTIKTVWRNKFDFEKKSTVYYVTSIGVLFSLICKDEGDQRCGYIFQTQGPGALKIQKHTVFVRK